MNRITDLKYVFNEPVWNVKKIDEKSFEVTIREKNGDDYLIVELIYQDTGIVSGKYYKDTFIKTWQMVNYISVVNSSEENIWKLILIHIQKEFFKRGINNPNFS